MKNILINPVSWHQWDNSCQTGEEGPAQPEIPRMSFQKSSNINKLEKGSGRFTTHYKNLRTNRRKDSCRNPSPESLLVPHQKRNLRLRTHEENRMFNAGLVANVEGGFSIVPFFKKTPMPLNSKNLKWTINQMTKQKTFTRKSNFASPKWSEPPSKSALPPPPTKWLLPRAEFEDEGISMTSTWNSCSSGLGSSLEIFSDDSFFSALSDLEKVRDESDCDSFLPVT